MTLFYKIILLVILSSYTLLEASVNQQKIILEYSKNPEYITTKLQEAQSLSKEYNLSYRVEQFSDYFTITIAPIETVELQESLYMLFQPRFPRLFVVNISSNRKESKIESAKKTTLLLESLENVDEKEVIESLRKVHSWIEKWYILLILFILGLYFFYRKYKEISEIQNIQEQFAHNQDRMNF